METKNMEAPGQSAPLGTQSSLDTAELKAALKHLRTEPRGWMFTFKASLCAVLVGTGVVLALQPAL
jgi:hypothetical protein